MAFKARACSDYARQGLSSVTRPYFDAQKARDASKHAGDGKNEEPAS